MSNLIRFGRKIPMPSTIEIKHDLRLMASADAVVAASDEPQTAEMREQLAHIVGDLAAKHGLSRDRAAMLVARFGIARDTLEGAAQNLRASQTFGASEG
jgi:hypothetical protein